MWRVLLAIVNSFEPVREAPCLPERPVLSGPTMFGELVKYSGFMVNDPPKGRYGTCTIADAQIRDAKGALVGELTCGLHVHVPGIIDAYGFEVGMSAARVAAIHEHAAARILCVNDGPEATRCWFEPEGIRDANFDGAAEPSHYVVAGSIGDTIVRGRKALAFFTAGTLTQINVRGFCH